MTTRLLAVAIAIIFALATTPAHARHHHKKHYRTYDQGQTVAHPPGCPWRQFCGCGVSVKIFGRPIRGLFLAANWRKFPSAHASAGMVAWRYGHVMAILSVNGDGTAVVYDPNSGHHQTRIHNRSLAGYRIVNPHGANYASAL